MDKLDLNYLLNRKSEEEVLKENLIYFEENKKSYLQKEDFIFMVLRGLVKLFL